MTQLTIELSSQLSASLSHLVAKTGKSTSFYISEALSEYFHNKHLEEACVDIPLREVPALSEAQRENMEKMYASSGKLTEAYFYEKLGIRKS